MSNPSIWASLSQPWFFWRSLPSEIHDDAVYSDWLLTALHAGIAVPEGSPLSEHKRPFIDLGVALGTREAWALDPPI